MRKDIENAFEKILLKKSSNKKIRINFHPPLQNTFDV